jgi:P pilus assembly chaperone PapD
MFGKALTGKMRRLSVLVFFSFGGGYVPVVLAGTTLNSTPIIFNAGQGNISTIVSNVSNKDHAVRVLVSGRVNGDKGEIPFIAMPALFKLRPGEEQVVRIIKTPAILSPVRESAFYFDVREVLDASKDYHLPGSTIRTRVKLFYRPDSLKEKPGQTPSTLQWSLVDRPSGKVLRVKNPGPYHVSFVGVRLLGADNNIELPGDAMLEPFSTGEYAVTGRLSAPVVGVKFSIINDYGKLEVFISQTSI